MKIFFVLLTVILVIGLITGIYSNSEKKAVDEFGRIIEDSNIDTGVDNVNPGIVDEDVVYERPEGRPYDPLYEPTASFTLANVKMKYPPILTAKIENNLANFTHQTPSPTHHDACDFKGDGIEKTSITDFNAVIRIGGDLNSEIDEYNKGDTEIKKGGKYVEVPGYFEKVIIGKKTGFKFIMGVEGCGQYTYLIRLDKETSIILVHSFVPELLGVVGDYSTTPGIIQLDDSEVFVKQIISSATVLQP